MTREVSRTGAVTEFVADAVWVGAVVVLVEVRVYAGAVGTAAGPLSPQASSPAEPIIRANRIRRRGATAESTVPLVRMPTAQF